MRGCLQLHAGDDEVMLGSCGDLCSAQLVSRWTQTIVGDMVLVVANWSLKELASAKLDWLTLQYMFTSVSKKAGGKATLDASCAILATSVVRSLYSNGE